MRFRSLNIRAPALLLLAIGPVVCAPAFGQDDTEFWEPFLREPPFRIRVTHIKFDHKGPNTGTGDGLNIRQSYAKELAHQGNGRGTGEWDEDRGRNEAALYVANKSVTIKVRFVTTAPITSARIRGVADQRRFRNVQETLINFDAQGVSTPEYTQMQVDGRTGLAVAKTTDRWWWVATEINGNDVVDLPFDRTGPHTVYTALDVPTSPWYDNGKQQPWVDALEFTIATAGTDGKRSVPAAANQLTGFVFGAYGLEYETTAGDSAYVSGSVTTGTLDLTGFMDKSNGAVVNCHDNAVALVAMTNLLGGSSAWVAIQNFGYLSRTALIGQGTVNNPVYLYFNRGLDTCNGGSLPTHNCNDDIISDAKPHKRALFAGHGIMDLGNTVYDATVGPHKGVARAAYITAAVDVSNARERPGATVADFMTPGTVKLK